jgi:hypothetical protein
MTPLRRDRPDRGPRIEVEQGHRERCGLDPLITLCGQVIQYARQQDPARAEADHAEFVTVTDLADRIHRRQDTLGIRIHPQPSHVGGRIAPAQDENLQPTAHRVFDEASRRPKVEEVVTTDRRRHD